MLMLGKTRVHIPLGKSLHGLRKEAVCVCAATKMAIFALANRRRRNKKQALGFVKQTVAYSRRTAADNQAVFTALAQVPLEVRNQALRLQRSKREQRHGGLPQDLIDLVREFVVDSFGDQWVEPATVDYLVASDTMSCKLADYYP
jgi:hypothetical protein